MFDEVVRLGDGIADKGRSWQVVQAFEAAARLLSFRKAAEELSVTPTAVSHQIRLLERYCGQALFQRQPRPLQLTTAGALWTLRRRNVPAVFSPMGAFAPAALAISRCRKLNGHAFAPRKRHRHVYAK